jgi:hypothetical protein
MVVALLLVLSAAPATSTARGGLERINSLEAVNDALEPYLDGLCRALKGGQRDLRAQGVAAAAQLPSEAFVQVTACSLRALALERDDGHGLRRARLLWELDGRTATGARRSARGEGQATLRYQGEAWSLLRLDTSGATALERPGRRLRERAEAGLTFPQRTAPRHEAELQAAGLSVRDLDGDGLRDVIALDGPTAWLFRGRPGLTFAPAEALARAPNGGLFTAAALGDVDSDGAPDLALTLFKGGPVRLLRNVDGGFAPWQQLGDGGLHQSALFTDLEGDGLLDLVVVPYPLARRAPTFFLEADNGAPIEVFRGQRDGGFARWDFPAPLVRKRWGLAAAAGPFGTFGHGLYVANDFGTNDLWLFSPDGGVREEAAAVGLTDPGNGMSVDLGDLDGDGTLDVYIANMFSKAGTRVLAGVPEGTRDRALLLKFARGNTLYLGDGDGGYAERATTLGVNRGLWAFGSVFLDVDDDGASELAVANGYFSHPDRKDL